MVSSIADIQIDIHVMFEISLSVISFLDELELISLHTNIAIVSTQLNGFNYCYLAPIILFNINHLFTHRELYSKWAKKQQLNLKGLFCFMAYQPLLVI